MRKRTNLTNQSDSPRPEADFTNDPEPISDNSNRIPSKRTEDSTILKDTPEAIYEHEEYDAILKERTPDDFMSDREHEKYSVSSAPISLSRVSSFAATSDDGVSMATCATGQTGSSAAPVVVRTGKTARIICVICAFAVSTFVASACGYLLLGVLLSVVGTLGSHLLGNWLFPCYELYMPFCGGTEFMLLQAQGYTIVGFANIVAICHCWGNYDESTLFLLALAFAQVVAMWVTTQALFFYKGRGPSKGSINHEDVQLWRLDKKTPVFIVLGCACFAYGYFFLGTGFTIVSTIYSALDPLINDVRGWKLWQPMEGGKAFVMLQAQGWLMLGLLLNVVGAITHLDVTNYPATGLGCAILHSISLICLSASVNLFHVEQQRKSERKDAKYRGAHLYVPLRTKTFYFLQVLAAIVILAALPFLFCQFASVCTVNQLMVPLLAAPMAHTSGWYFIPTYRGFRLSGGFRSMLLQTNGWLLYLIAIVSSQMHSRLILTMLTPAGSCGALCIALSVYFHEDVETDKKEKGQPLAWYMTFGSLCVLLVAWLNLTSVQLAVFALALHTLAVPLGIHIMWTHWWLAGCLFVYFVNNEFLLATFMVMGCGLCVPWYLVGFTNFNSFLGFRALAGWSLFMGKQYQEAVGPFSGKKDFKGPFHHGQSMMDKCVLYGSFLCVDVAMHLIPCLLMLQFIGSLTPGAVIVAYLIGQVWRRTVSFHHLSPDWDLFWSSWRVDWHRRKHSPGYRFGGKDIDAFSAIYGFTNSDFPVHPEERLNWMERVELIVHIALLIVYFAVTPSMLQVIADVSALVAEYLLKFSAAAAFSGNVGLIICCLRGWYSVEK
eukprot:GEMP01008971.1.p1 GENE.GEMP01008971.1~~GEMP01008971.1.p1  ORF type:complete len:832 (-),score=164.30 GEMP01008971.1:751-3246(-)